ncbi:MAG: PspA-associated protein PspAA [Solirubrobacteraceae bacterium]
MIVRISGEDQYRLPDGDAKLAQLDSAVAGAVDAGDESAFASAFAALVDHVRGGERVGEHELEPSDLILPPADLSFAEAREDFRGEGLVPD